MMFARLSGNRGTVLTSTPIYLQGVATEEAILVLLMELTA